MHKVLSYYFIGIFCSLSFMAAAQQEHKSGKLVGGVPRLLVKQYFQSGRYLAYEEPESLKNPNFKQFNESQYSESRTLVEAYLVADSKEWFIKLKEDTILSKDMTSSFQYRKSRGFNKDYLFEVLVEFTFALDNEIYNALVIRHNNGPGEYTVMPYITVLTEDGWRITSSKEMSEFSGFLLIQPKYFTRFLKGEISGTGKEVLFDKAYRWNTFYLDQGFSMKAFLARKNMSDLSDVLIQDRLRYKHDKSYNLKFTEPIAAGISYYWSRNPGKCYKMFWQKSETSSTQIAFTYSQAFKWYDTLEFDKSPEKALASWMFEKDTLKKKLHVTKPEKLNLDFSKGYHINHEYHKISFLSKYIFEKNNEVYVLLYFDNKIPRNENERGTAGHIYTYGTFRFLLTWREDQWMIETSPDRALQQFVYVIDQINTETQVAAFSDNTNDDALLLYVGELGLRTEEDFIDISSVYNNWELFTIAKPKEVKREHILRNEMPEVFPKPVYK